jgi:hypothetical protein
VRQQYLTWIADPARELTETWKIKSASFSEIVRFISAERKAITERIIVRSFKKYCLNNALDGSENDILQEGDGEVKNDSDWVTDSDSVMSNDSESDE